jgi:hypothetical protein
VMMAKEKPCKQRDRATEHGTPPPAHPRARVLPRR